MLDKLEKIKTWHLFLFIVFVEMIIYYITDNYVMTREFYEKLLGDRLTLDMINTQFELAKKFRGFGYLFIPIVTLIKITLFALLLQFPLLLKFIEIPFSKLFRICSFAILPFIFLQIITTWRSTTIPISELSQQALSVIPFSINSILDPMDYSKSVFQFLGFFHIFWIFWGMILFFGLTKTEKIEKLDGILYTTVVFMVLVVFNFGITSYITKVFG